jgi:hypothetical protein
VPEVKNRVTGRSMGEHTEDMSKDREQDELALEGHQRAIAAQDRGFFSDLLVPVDGKSKDHFPRRVSDLGIKKIYTGSVDLDQDLAKWPRLDIEGPGTAILMSDMPELDLK